MLNHPALTRLLWWISEVPKTWRRDLLAAVAVAVVLVPQSMAYAQVAGLPAYYGLYASSIPMILAAALGASRYMSTGPAVVVSLLTYTAVSEIATPGSPEFIIGVSVLAAFVGVIQLALAFARFGAVIHFVSHPVIVGFTNAAALIIAATQLPRLFDILSPSDSHVLSHIWAVIQNLHLVSLETAVIAGVSVFLLLLGKFLKPSFPMVLVVVASATFYSFITGYSGQTVGVIPQGLPAVAIPTISAVHWVSLLQSAGIISLIAFMEGYSIAKTLAAKRKEQLDSNRELAAQGVANVAASFFHAGPVAGSFSRSAIAFDAGARTPLTSIGAATVVILSLVYLAPILEHIPSAVLAAIIITAVIKLLDISQIMHWYTVYRSDFVVAVFTFGATLLFSPHLDYGILLGIVVALLMQAQRGVQVPVDVFVASDTHYTEKHKLRLHESKYNKNVLAVSFDFSLAFTNVTKIEEKILTAVRANRDIKYVLIFSRSINYIDATAEGVIQELDAALQSKGIQLYFVGVRPAVSAFLERSHLDVLNGRKKIFNKVNDALRAIEKVEKKATGRARSG